MEGLTESPSSVFLALWRYWEHHEPAATVKDFAAMADTWQQIREMEAISLRRSGPVVKVDMLEPADLPVSVLRDPEPAPEETREADIPPRTTDAAPPEKPAPKRNDSDIGKKSFATRKRNALAALDHARRDGVTMQQISEAGRNLTLTQILDAIDRKPLPLPVWTGLEKALGKLGYPPSQEARVDPAEPNIDASSASIEEAF